VAACAALQAEFGDEPGVDPEGCFVSYYELERHNEADYMTQAERRAPIDAVTGAWTSSYMCLFVPYPSPPALPPPWPPGMAPHPPCVSQWGASCYHNDCCADLYCPARNGQSGQTCQYQPPPSPSPGYVAEVTQINLEAEHQAIVSQAHICTPQETALYYEDGLGGQNLGYRMLFGHDWTGGGGASDCTDGFHNGMDFQSTPVTTISSVRMPSDVTPVAGPGVTATFGKYSHSTIAHGTNDYLTVYNPVLGKYCAALFVTPSPDFAATYALAWNEWPIFAADGTLHVPTCSLAPSPLPPGMANPPPPSTPPVPPPSPAVAAINLVDEHEAVINAGHVCDTDDFALYYDGMVSTHLPDVSYKLLVAHDPTGYGGQYSCDGCAQVPTEVDGQLKCSGMEAPSDTAAHLGGASIGGVIMPSTERPKKASGVTAVFGYYMDTNTALGGSHPHLAIYNSQYYRWCFAAYITPSADFLDAYSKVWNEWPVFKPDGTLHVPNCTVAPSPSPPPPPPPPNALPRPPPSPPAGLVVTAVDLEAESAAAAGGTAHQCDTGTHALYYASSQSSAAQYKMMYASMTSTGCKTSLTVSSNDLQPMRTAGIPVPYSSDITPLIFGTIPNFFGTAHYLTVHDPASGLDCIAHEVGGVDSFSDALAVTPKSDFRLFARDGSLFPIPDCTPA
jgi:hypothetical protein